MDNVLLSEPEEEKLIESPEVQEIREALEKCQKKADEYLTGWKRAKADFVNREKDIERQRQEWITFGNTTFLHALLPAYEAFVKAMREASEDVLGSAWGKGMVHVQKNFDDFLKKMGVVKIDVLGKKFDPMHHEVVAKRQEPLDSARGRIAPDTIVEVVKEGYTLHGKPFVTPKVIIAE